MLRQSMFGGAPIFIRSNGGFDQMPVQNQVVLESQNIAGAKYFTHAVTDDEAFASNTPGGMLAYTVPSVFEIFSNPRKQFTYYDFDGVTLPTATSHSYPQPNNLSFEVSVMVGDETLICKSAKWGACHIVYDEMYTPMFWDTSPNQVTFGQTINFVMYANLAHKASDLPAGLDPFYYLKIGNILTDWEALIDSGTRLPEGGIGAVTTRVGKNPPTKSADPDVNFTKFGRANLKETSKHCNFAGTECWRVRVHPKIDKINYASGYVTGGQRLEIEGFGLLGASSTSVLVDGIPCLISQRQSTDEKLVCETGPKATVSVIGPQPGQPGITHTFVNPADPKQTPHLQNIFDGTYPTTKWLDTTIETLWNVYDEKAYHLHEGWFKAPDTGRYRFYMQADDNLRLFLDVANPYDPVTPVTTSLVEVGQSLNAVGWRRYHHISSYASAARGKFVTEWLNLIEGKYYKLRSVHLDWGGASWGQVAVEFEKPGSVDHPMAAKAVQSLRIEQDNVAETWTLVINNPSSGKFKVGLKSPKETTTWLSGEIASNLSAFDMYLKIRDFFTADARAATDINVTLKMYDAANAETAIAASATKYIYTIKAKKRISGFSFTSGTAFIIAPNTSTVVINGPSQPGGIASSAPMSGNFVVSCTDKKGVTHKSPNIYQSQWDEGLRLQILSGMPFLAGKVMIYDAWDGDEDNAWKYLYKENGRNLIFVFNGFQENPPLCTLESAANIPTVGNNVRFVSEVLRPFGQSLFFEPVGLEFLYSDAQKPQVLVEVDGLPALCMNLNCDYTYVAANAELTSQVFDQQSNQVTVTGTNLPTTGLKVKFGGVSCKSTPAPIYSNTLIQCTLKNAPVAGDHKAEIRDANGLLPYAAGVLDIRVPLTISSATTMAANALGGDILTIAGTGFSTNPSDMLVKLTSSAGESLCIVKTSSPTQFTCEVQKMTNSDGLARTLSISVKNIRYVMRRRELQTTTQTSNPSITITQQSGLPTVQSIVGGLTDVSPIIKQPLTFQLSPEYTNTLTKADLVLVQIKNDAKNYSRDLYVMNVDDTQKQFTIKFNGAPPGTYYFAVTSATYGRLQTSAISFKTSSVITSVSPSSGSVFGGSLLTITGTNFSTNKQDLAVKVGDYYCDILTSSMTGLTCRIRATGLLVTDVRTADVVLFLAASFEVLCEQPANCQFSFQAPASKVTSLTTGFDSTANVATATLVGEGFTAGDTSSVSLYIDGVKQTTSNVSSSTSATFIITELKSSATTNAQVFFAEGNPGGFNLISSLTFTPKFVSVNPNSAGSQGGTLVTVIGTGFGVNTTGLGLLDKTSATALCQSVQVVAYGKFTCMTKPQAVQSTDQLKMTIGTTEYACVNTNTALCQYSQTAATSPTITAVSISGNVVTLTGVNFPANPEYTASITIKSSGGVVSSQTTTLITATFSQGIPATAITEQDVAKITFTRLSDGLELVSYSNGVTFEATVSAPVTAATISSYAGGIKYTMTANNLYASLQEAGNSVTMCGNKCLLSASDSDSSKAVCITPALSTTFSSTNYKIGKKGTIKEGVWTSSASATEVNKVSDDKWPTEFTDTSATPFIELAFIDDHVGVLDAVKIFIKDLLDKTPFVGTKLQGFNGSSYVDITTLDAQIHEGWNTFDFSTSKPSYSKYRWSGTKVGSCRFGEVKFIGTVSVNAVTATKQCTPKLTISGVTTDLQIVTYSDVQTPTISRISPRYGKVQGGETITIDGTNFVTGATSVTIDGKVCSNPNVTPTQITCTTGSRPGDEKNPTFVVMVDNSGLAATQGNTFRYVSYWSEPATWGNDAPPQFGEAIEIPAGRSLLVDVDAVPQLSFIVVYGALLFAPDPNPLHQRKFDAGYIFINGGYMEVGTEEFPYTSKITITMHGDVTTPAIPTYGNKNIAVRRGELHLVGPTREVTWTMLDSTSDVGSNQITLSPQPDAFDWAVGEEIVIASTDYDHKHAEKALITAISDHAADAGLTKRRKVITLNINLMYKHYAEKVTFGSTDFIEMRAEVGLLTRNVKYQGDPETSQQNKYGAHIMIHYPDDESCIGRILYTEFFNVGQAFKLGRYPIHFHVIGTVAKSLVKGNAIHQTYNRAVTIHAVSYFNVENNVIYNTMGHSIFIEDAIETKNVIKNNLVVSTLRSWSLLNTDQTPASFWITRPDNIFIGNHAAGSDRYGFWFDLQINPINGSYTPTICPKYEKLGEFRDNESHSNGRYGLRIFHGIIPRTRPCEPWTYDNSNPSLPGAPYASNPTIPAQFVNFVGWKNQFNGAIAEDVGAVEFINFKVADNILAGIEMSLGDVEIYEPDVNLVKNALVIGSTPNSEDVLLLGEGTRGIIGPRSDYFTIRDTKFYNFNFGKSGALSDCSHCFFLPSTDSGARQYVTSNLFFDAQTVPKRIWWQYPFRGIILDQDGSLTGLGSNSWAVAYFPYNDFSGECTLDNSKYDGHICNPTVQVRRVCWYAMSPGTFTGQNLMVRQYDDSMTSGLSATQLAAFQKDTAAYSIVQWKAKNNPENAWAAPFVTGHKYRIYWSIGELNWTEMKIEVARTWKPTDKQILFNQPYTDNYENVDFFSYYNKTWTSDTDPLFYPGTTLDVATKLNWLSGYNKLDTTAKEINYVITGNTASSKTLQAISVKCRANQASWCTVSQAASACTGTAKNWSDPLTWATTQNPAGSVPVAGQDVTIPNGVSITFDLAESPKLNLVTVLGCLSFRADNTINQTFHAQSIYVLGGKFNIGTATTPYTKKARIVLYGDFDSPYISMPGAEAGNKMIANTGTVTMVGKDRSRMSRLTAECQKGSTTCTIGTGLDWVAGEKIGFAPTASQRKHYEWAIISSYNSATGALVLTEPLKFYHFGAAASTGAKYQGVDMRGEVILLNRNIVIEGDMTSNDWHGQFLTTDIILLDPSGNPIDFKGQTNLKNVEFYKMGQANNEKAAIRFDQSNLSKTDGSFASVIENVVIHESAGWGIKVIGSSNISFKNVDVFDVTHNGLVWYYIKNISGDGINVIGVQRRKLAMLDMQNDKEACFSIGTWIYNSSMSKIKVVNSIAAGCPYAGFLAPGHRCTDPVGQSSSNIFRDNVAHSVEGSGYNVFPDNGNDWSNQRLCYQFSYLAAYKCTQGSIGTLQGSMQVQASYIVSIDNTWGISLGLSDWDESGNETLITLKNSYLYGETADLAKDCPDGKGSATGAECYCVPKMGHMNASAIKRGKTPHNEVAVDRPVNKLKTHSLWNVKATLYGMNFMNFPSEKTQCGSTQSIFGFNSYGADLIPPHYFYYSTFTNVKYDAIAYFYDPPIEWAVIDDCGEWPCTAPSNAVYSFNHCAFAVTDGVTQLPSFWTAGTTTEYTFQIVSDFPTAASSYPNCSKNEIWNAWFCADPAQVAAPLIGQLYFESLDGDTWKRSVQPVVITNSDGYKNVLNSFMDHGWDGFYTSQLRLSRFPAQIQTGKSYTIQYTGTPFNNARYVLNADANAKGVLLKIPYPNAVSFSVKVNGNIVPPQPWDTATKAPKEIDVNTATCGANLYRGVYNYLQFFLTPGCTVVVIPRDSIHSSTRLQWTAAEFFAAGGVTTFTQRLASVLGVDITRVKVVAVYEGSLIVETQILDNPDTQTVNADGTVQPSATTKNEMKALQTSLQSAMTAGNTSLGAAVLEFAVTKFQTSSTEPETIASPTIMPVNVPVPTGALATHAFNLTFALCVFIAAFF